MKPDAASFDLDYEETRAKAHRYAELFRGSVATWQASGLTSKEQMAAAMRIARSRQVQLPNTQKLPEVINRMSHPLWWTTALRRRRQLVEQAEIDAGQVHVHASPIVSRRALQRAEQDRKRNADFVEAARLVNRSTGEIVPLAEVAARSVANPSMRRKALMARLRGVEDYAKGKGYEEAFAVLTCPSRMHPRQHRSGQPNPRHDGTTVRQAHAYLCRLWHKATRQANREGLQVFGVRTVEPHHDACPHWNIVAYAPAGHMGRFLSILRAHALADSPDEPGAQERRLRVEPIDPAKGSALSYAAKYVSKNIDGLGVDEDTETGIPGADVARRNVTWARTWRVRQFQFFGLPPITASRELYRQEVARESLGSAALQAAHDATRANDYAQWLRELEASGIKFSPDRTERPSRRYADESTHRLVGLWATACDLPQALHITTRSEEWVIELPRQPEGGSLDAGFAFPWTRSNNCATPCESTGYAHSQAVAASRSKRATRSGRRRRPPPSSGLLFAAS